MRNFSKSIRHFKLSNGDELVCDVVEWPDEHEGPNALVIRNAFKIFLLNPIMPGENRYYQFRPWMVYQDNPEYFQILNGDHILAEASPSEEMLMQYARLLSDEDEENQSLEDVSAKIKEMLDLVNAEEVDLYGDSDFGNLIQFPGGKRLH